ncbi:MAG: methylmalonyl-CoA mutase family protein [Bacteroidota bacterium]|nr:methylmalonyl-CoA mutase family protein [Bacteroidota bacterium]
MDQNKKDSKLFSEFPPVSTQQWEDVINKDLKGADYNKRLMWRTREGFTVKPYYRSEDTQDLNHLDSFPGDFPYTRGNNAKGNNWYIRQDIKVKDIKKTNTKALEILMKGVNSIGFVFEHNYDPTSDELKQLLEGIHAEAVELNFINVDSHKTASLVEKILKKSEFDLTKISGSVGYDPIGNFIKTGSFCRSEQQSLEYAGSVINATEHIPNFDAITVNAAHIKNSGSSIIQELGFGLAMGEEYINKLTDQGFSIDQIAPKMRFNFATGPIYFMEIAKLRAARLLWSNIVNAYNPEKAETAKMKIHSSNATWNKTIYDPYVNMLRTTTETMSSTLGGVHSFTVNPFNKIFEKTTPMSERIARNQQIILKEESYFDKVTDPAAGSYYVEQLTNSIAENAWNLFLEIQEQGGFIKAFRKGDIQAQINETAQKRDSAIATRKEVLLGTNQYPNFTETKEKIDIDPNLFHAEDKKAAGAETEPLRNYRGAQAFELMRYTTDKYSEKNARPKAFMFTYGNLSMRRARSQFASNYFACAGYETIDNNGFDTIDQGVEAAKKAKADIVVICSSDDEYATIAPEIFNKIGDDAIVVVAGYPKAIIDELQQKGIKHFIHVKTNVLETLQGFQKQLGIE